MDDKTDVKKGKTSLVAVLVVLSCIAIVLIGLYDDAETRSQQLIKYLDQHRKTFGTFPPSSQIDAYIKTLGEDEDSDRGPFYEINDNEFRVWYGTRLGVSRVYESKTRKWHDEG